MDKSEFLNAYAILNTEDLVWSINTYKLLPINGSRPSHEDRGKIKNIIWQLRIKYKNKCSGFGFVIDLDEETIAIPAAWNIPDQDNVDGYRMRFDQNFEARTDDSTQRNLLVGILRESIKNHFKNADSTNLGKLWQDYGDFCQMPQASPSGNGALFCRKFYVDAELLQGGRYVLKFEIGTRNIDSRTMDDYYRLGEVSALADMIIKKRANRVTRKNEPTAIRVWHARGDSAEVLELEEPEIILKHAELDPSSQQKLANTTISCVRYKQPPYDMSFNMIRLILDSKITQEEHSETIIEPAERMRWYIILHDYFDGMEAFGSTVRLGSNPIAVNEYESIQYLPPKLRVRILPDKVGYISSPSDGTSKALAKRAKDRSFSIRSNGYLEQRPINPLLAWPTNFSKERAERMRRDLNWHVKKQGLNFEFGSPLMYDSVHDIVLKLENETQYDTLLAVLPEGSWKANSDTDTHEQIKKRVQVPSQCIHHDNTLPPEWVNKKPVEFRKTDPRHASRIDNHYQQCLLNLLVKHHWVPFAPAESFFYNVHVGIDVGGMHNNRVMVCVGYGFAKSSQDLVFLPEEINIDIQQPEPIPTKYLFNGLYTIFEEMYHRLIDAGLQADFSKVLFFRDGELRGKGDVWNEIDALYELQKIFYKNHWIGSSALWTAVEISKRAGDWRVLEQLDSVVENPLVGRCVFPFNDRNTAIVCTTGKPYLTQGTASPLIARIKDIYGKANRDEVLRDLIWEADMCFTKLDTGMSLPWVLHVANSGALQQSKAYKITGITV